MIKFICTSESAPSDSYGNGKLPDGIQRNASGSWTAKHPAYGGKWFTPSSGVSVESVICLAANEKPIHCRAHYAGTMIVQPDDVVILSAPMIHHGVQVGTWCQAFITGKVISEQPMFEPGEIEAFIAELERVGRAMGAPV